MSRILSFLFKKKQQQNLRFPRVRLFIAFIGNAHFVLTNFCLSDIRASLQAGLGEGASEPRPGVWASPRFCSLISNFLVFSASSTLRVLLLLATPAGGRHPGLQGSLPPRFPVAC